MVTLFLRLLGTHRETRQLYLFVFMYFTLIIKHFLHTIQETQGRILAYALQLSKPAEQIGSISYAHNRSTCAWIPPKHATVTADDVCLLGDILPGLQANDLTELICG